MHLYLRFLLSVLVANFLIVAPLGAKVAKPFGALSALDYAEIERLYADYAFAIDTGDGKARAATFTADGTFSSSLSQHQPESMSAVAERTTRQGNVGVRHLMTNISVKATPGGAEARCHVFIISGASDDHEQSSATDFRSFKGLSGFYFDKLVRTPAGWRFKSREVWLDSEANSPYRADSAR